MPSAFKGSSACGVQVPSAFKGSRACGVQGFKACGVQGFKGLRRSRVSEFQSSRVQVPAAFKGSRESEWFFVFSVPPWLKKS